MILTLPPAYIGGPFGVEFDLAVARISLALSAERSSVPELPVWCAGYAAAVKLVEISLDKTLKNHVGKIRKEYLIYSVYLPECSPLISRFLLVVDWLTVLQ